MLRGFVDWPRGGVKGHGPGERGPSQEGTRLVGQQQGATKEANYAMCVCLMHLYARHVEGETHFCPRSFPPDLGVKTTILITEISRSFPLVYLSIYVNIFLEHFLSGV